MSHRPSSLRSFLSCTCLSLTIALPALCVSRGHAQNALQNDLGGSNGNALDNNLKMNSAGQRIRGNNANTQRNYGLGNLGVTGGLAGGRNFRLDDEARQLGLEDSYLGVNDFRGQLGSDDIFNELQGSALSQIEFVTSGLANQSYLNASGLGMFEYRRDFTQAEGPYGFSQGNQINQNRIRLDRMFASNGSSDLYDSAVSPNSIRFMQMENQDGNPVPIVIESNDLQGVYRRPLMFSSVGYGRLNTFQRASLLDSISRGELTREQVGSPYQSSQDRVPAELLLNPDFGAPQPEAGVRLGTSKTMDAYQKAIRQMVETYADRDDVSIAVDPALLTEIQNDLDRLRRVTLEVRPDGEGSDGFDLESYIESLEESDEPTSETEVILPENESDEERDERIEREEREAFIDRSLEMIRNGGSIDSFLEGQQGRIRTLMEKGEELLRRASYFDAEQRFDEILTINPGNPLALLGRATSQLGAGLYLSTSFSLKKLFTNYPEMAGMVLDEQFQPNVIRLKIAENKIRTRIDRGTDLPSYGLCLAYVGKLLGEPEVIEEGLKLLDETDGDVFLSGFLGKIWLGVEPSDTEP